MNSTQIIHFICGNLILAVGLVSGTIIINSHKKERVLTNSFSYCCALAEYILGIGIFIISICLFFRG